MEGRLKYRPSKTQLTLREMRELLEMYRRENDIMRDTLKEAESALKWARDTLIKKEEENRRLKLVIMRLTEQEGHNA